MEIKQYKAKGCCGSSSLFFKISEPISQIIVDKFIDLGMIQEEHYSKAGIMYVHNSSFIITGPFGSNKVQFKCKQSPCAEHQQTLIRLLESL